MRRARAISHRLKSEIMAKVEKNIGEQQNGLLNVRTETHKHYQTNIIGADEVRIKDGTAHVHTVQTFLTWSDVEGYVSSGMNALAVIAPWLIGFTAVALACKMAYVYRAEIAIGGGIIGAIFLLYQIARYALKRAHSASNAPTAQAQPADEQDSEVITPEIIEGGHYAQIKPVPAHLLAVREARLQILRPDWTPAERRLQAIMEYNGLRQPVQQVITINANTHEQSI